jgi:O-antigen/teichoic acid export membrane protein
VIVLARFFPPEELGLYGLMVSAVAIATFLLGLEYHYFTMRAVIGRPPASQVAVMRDQAVLYTVVASVALPLLALLMWTDRWAPVPKSALAWFLVLVVVELAAQEAGIALIALARPLAANLVLFVRSGAWVYPVIALAIFGVREIGYVFLAWLAGALASLAVAAWSLRGMGWRAALTEPINWSAMRAGLRVAAPFVVTTGASMGLLFLDRFIIAAYSGLGPVGVYTFFAGITTALHTLVNTGISLVRMPMLVEAAQDADEGRFRSELATMARITIVSTLLLALVIAAGIVPLLQVVGKAVYQENLVSFFLLLAAAMIRCVADLPLYALYAKHRDLPLLAVNVTAFLVNVVLNVVLIPVFGLAGAAGSAVAGATILFVFAAAVAVRGRGRIMRAAAEDAPPARSVL